MQIDLQEIGLGEPEESFLNLDYLGLCESDKEKIKNTPFAFGTFIKENTIKIRGVNGRYIEDAGDNGKGLVKLWLLYLCNHWQLSYWEPDLGHIDIENAGIDIPSGVFKRVWKATRDAYITYLKDGEDAMLFSGQSLENQEKFVFDDTDFILFIGPVKEPYKNSFGYTVFWRLVIAYFG